MDTSTLNTASSISIAAVIMASGHSTRFHGNKLWADVNGIPMIQQTFHIIPKNCFSLIVVVSRDEKILNIA